MESAIWGLIGTVVGALASIGTTWLTTISSSKLQNEKTRDERLERANAFQRETLLELQEALHDTLRLVSRAYIKDCESLRAGVAWSNAMLGDQLDENLLLSKRRIAILVERVADENVRQHVKTVIKIATQSMLAPDESTARRHLDQCVSEADRLFETLGSTLRMHY